MISTLYATRTPTSSKIPISGSTGTTIAEGWIPWRANSAGIIDTTEPTFTDNGDGTGTFGACNVALYDNSNFTGKTAQYAVAEATLSFTAGTQEYACIHLSAGVAHWQKETSFSSISGSDSIVVYVIWRQNGGDLLHSSGQDSLGIGLADKINQRLFTCSPYAISTIEGSVGFLISETTSPVARTINVTGCDVYAGTAKQTVGDFTSETDLLTKVIHTAGGWTFTSGQYYDNSHYNPDGLGEVSLTANRYAYRLYFRSIGDVKEVFYVESPAEYTTLEAARVASEYGRTSLPILLQRHCLPIGRSLIKNGATSGITEPFIATGGQFLTMVPQHNDLVGLQGGTTDEYYHSTSAQHTTWSKITESGGAPLWNGSNWPQPLTTNFLLMGA